MSSLQHVLVYLGYNYASCVLYGCHVGTTIALSAGFSCFTIYLLNNPLLLWNVQQANKTLEEP